MDEFTTERELLEQIRDLLRPISAVYRPQYEELVRNQRREQVDAILEVAGRGAKRIAACRLMDGSLTRKQIAAQTRIDSGDLSRLVGALREKQLVDENGGRPCLVVEPNVVWSD